MTYTAASRTAPRTESGRTIQEVSRLTGLSEPTLRYYEQVGLIRPVPRDDSSGHRRYTDTDVRILESLACLRGAGMRIDDMRRYLRLAGTGTHEAAAEQAELFHAHERRIADQIERLQVRQAYLHWKCLMWDARARGDAEAEQAATAQVIRYAEQF